jgi:hypothetical protein
VAPKINSRRASLVLFKIDEISPERGAQIRSETINSLNWVAISVKSGYCAGQPAN